MIKIWDLKGRLNVVNFFGYQGFIISIVFLENGMVYCVLLIIKQGDSGGKKIFFWYIIYVYLDYIYFMISRILNNYVIMFLLKLWNL